jgi:hypothetical protein
MTISDKTRKVLWGRSGNRCAMCQGLLVEGATPKDDESVIGDECHIVSGRPGGPRFDKTFPVELLDDYENLILLCRVHHKVVDDQCETYLANRLLDLKKKHETWVSSSLSRGTGEPPSGQVRRKKGDTPSHLLRLSSGKEIMAIVGDACEGSIDHDELQSEGEMELIAGFLQEVQDWGELWSGLGAGERVRTCFRVNTLLGELEEAGFRVFGGRQAQQLEGGVGPPLSFPLAILRVVRATNPEIYDLQGQRVPSSKPGAGKGS